jgi:hypothetical protein
MDGNELAAQFIRDAQWHDLRSLMTSRIGAYAIQHFESELRALLRDEIMTAIQGAGYEEARWHDPEESGYYQPIVTARNRNE